MFGLSIRPREAPRKPSPPGKGDRRRRWMRRGTTFCIVGTAGAGVGTLYLATYNASTDSPSVSATFNAAPRPSSVSPTGEPASPRGSFFAFLRIRLLFLQCFTLPRGPHQSRPRGEPASPRGSFCTMLWVVPFNSTGCIRDVDGGRSTPLHRIRPTKYHFSIRLGYRDVAGGRLPPLRIRR